ncbi:hypothetical protein LCGC14_0175820 [marine sediment metagenome]|uniref:Uncharacterized protein n=1 Tax=marine sediment metagenome TaxID=412755 RepID=A0A0F9XTT5_9ZZZZ
MSTIIDQKFETITVKSDADEIQSLLEEADLLIGLNTYVTEINTSTIEELEAEIAYLRDTPKNVSEYEPWDMGELR